MVMTRHRAESLLCSDQQVVRQGGTKLCSTACVQKEKQSFDSVRCSIWVRSHWDKQKNRRMIQVRNNRAAWRKDDMLLTGCTMPSAA
jgi:hypothetical protein